MWASFTISRPLAFFAPDYGCDAACDRPPLVPRVLLAEGNAGTAEPFRFTPPEAVAYRGVTTFGQIEPSSGQGTPHPGQAKELATERTPHERPKPGQLRTCSGQIAAPTEPPLDLQLVSHTWPELPEVIRRGIVAMVRTVLGTQSGGEVD